MTPMEHALVYLLKARYLGGSTGARLYETPEGKFVGKRGASPAHIQNEFDMNRYLNELGVPVPDARMVGGEMLTNYEGDEELGYNVSRDDLTQLSRDFVPHAVLANWDMIGMNADNVVRRPDGTLSYVDVGGAGAFRAQGAPKGAAFGTSVGELDTMRQKNPHFLTMPESRLGQSFDHYGGESAMTDALKVIRDAQTRNILQQRIQDAARRIA